MTLSTFTLLCCHRHHPSLDIFLHPKLKPCTQTLTALLPPPSSQELPLYALSLRLCLFQVPRVSGSLHCLSFCVWLISLSIISSLSFDVYINGHGEGEPREGFTLKFTSVPWSLSGGGWRRRGVEDELRQGGLLAHFFGCCLAPAYPFVILKIC